MINKLIKKNKILVLQELKIKTKEQILKTASNKEYVYKIIADQTNTDIHIKKLQDNLMYIKIQNDSGIAPSDINRTLRVPPSILKQFYLDNNITFKRRIVKRMAQIKSELSNTNDIGTALSRYDIMSFYHLEKIELLHILNDINTKKRLL
jgi:hypothetical protein